MTRIAGTNVDVDNAEMRGRYVKDPGALGAQGPMPVEVGDVEKAAIPTKEEQEQKVSSKKTSEGQEEK